MVSSTQKTSKTTDHKREHETEMRSEPTHGQIAQKAYEIWARKGKPSGQSSQNWAEAETELRKRSQSHFEHRM